MPAAEPLQPAPPDSGHSEFNLYSIDTELLESPGAPPIARHLLDVTDAVGVQKVFERYRPQVVFHAAAYKHVPLLEDQVEAAARNNVVRPARRADRAPPRRCTGTPRGAAGARRQDGDRAREFADGSVGTVHCLANGDKGFPKERLEVFCAGRVLQLDNFRKLRGWGWKGFSAMNLWRQDKGQAACAKAFVEAVRSGGAAPIAPAEVFEVSRVTIEVATDLG